MFYGGNMKIEISKKVARETDSFYAIDDYCDGCEKLSDYLEYYVGQYLCNKCLPEDLQKNQTMDRFLLLIGSKMMEKIKETIDKKKGFWVNENEFIIDSIRKHIRNTEYE